ncbi:Asp23/Gls24 family envelope stress response protein [Lacticaseibacillus paracasei]|uniref:Asp23/Gls24 family envelope stress response protein n=1 Tax=Lacticaseibacillus paracasei TaxID=1597 RepID=UPI0021A50FAD|nr:Asp23/Gls24 family envelope stress response protein [Lacticaseibacillus paracasei]MCT3335647.1 Asp23/Gls24 family envelope stress response protein [Lacticaseibacillus paracasei]
MAEETNIILANRTDAQGTIEIVPEVLEVILGIAASQVDGVYQMRGSLGASINAWFGRANHGKGVSVTVTDDQIAADVYVYLDYGVSVPKVALTMQERLREQLLFMTDLTLSEVNVHVVGIIPEKAEKVDPDNLFNDDDNDTDDAESASGKDDE